MIDWNLTYLSTYKIKQDEEGDKELNLIETINELEEKHENLRNFLTSLIQQAFKKAPSLSKTAKCKRYVFLENKEQLDSREIISYLHEPNSMKVFSSYAEIVATKYLRSGKSRAGILFILDAYVTLGKIKAPFLLILKTDFIPGIITEDNNIDLNENIIFPELKKAIIYPDHDGIDFKYAQFRCIQNSNDYFDRLFDADELMNSEQLENEMLRRELEDKFDGAYEKYFQIPEEDRTKKRDCFGESRLIESRELIESDEISHLSKLAQQKLVDCNVKPSKLRLNIDNQMKFDARTDLLNQTYYFARHGLEKYLIIKGNRFETKGAFKGVEFMELESLDETIARLKAESFNNKVVDDE